MMSRLEYVRRYGALILALATSVVAARVSFAQADPSSSSSDTQTTKEMLQEIRELKAQLAQVQKELHEVEAKDEQTVKAKVAADAEQRSELFPPNEFGIQYKDGKLLIASNDGNFLIHPWLHLQVRDSINFRQGAGPFGQNDTQNGFEIRRARFGFDGHMFTPDLQYFLNWASYRENGKNSVVNSAGQTIGSTTSSVGGTLVLEEAWALYHFHDTDWSIRAGQMHDPLAHEALIGSKARYPEASLQGDIFENTDTFTQAVTAIYDPGKDFRFEGGLTDGIRAANTNFEDFPNNGINYDWGIAGRAEYKAFGDWSDYKALTALGDKHELLVYGAGLDISQGDSTTTYSHTFDAQYSNPNGLMLYGAYFGRYITNNPGIALGGPVSTSITPAGTPGQDTYEWSALAQAAYLINHRWEPYVRYEYLWLAGTPAGSQNAVQDFSVGFNYYIFGQNVKVTTQLMYLPNGIPVSDDSSDVLINNGRTEIILMSQLQLLL